MAKATMLTAAGKRRLEAELQHLRDVQRPEAARLLCEAGEDGELDHPAYVDAQYRFEVLNARTERLARLLARAEVLDDHRGAADGSAGLGSEVTVVDQDGVRSRYTLVSSLEADPAAGRISTDSPVGRALFGQRAGATVAAVTPAATVRLQIVSVGAGA
ncbi:MAG TPA: GreA/GreB family elongation factor [Chloroflexota bacterium]|nr:GreA/GreB family elongation factor [Chloroflexota bacterium]